MLILSINFIFSQKYKIIKNSNYKITKLNQLNSEYRETNLSITPDGKYLFYMSDRGGQKWSVSDGFFKGKPSFDGDIWFSEKVNGKWLKAKPLSNKINTYSGEDEPNISPDGQKVYFESWNYWWATTGGPYYSAEINGTDWGTLYGLGGGINKFFVYKFDKNNGYATDGMAISPDGKTFIVACGKDYDGNLDYYISHKKNNEWTYPTKMAISTPEEERSIFIAGDNHTIFFASAGYGGFGGIDIFKAYIDDNGIVSNIENIGAPFNTKANDYGFIITADGKEAYFVRNGDIYMAQLDTNNELKPAASIVISGVLTDCHNRPHKQEIYLQNKKTKKIITTQSNSAGKFVFSLPAENGIFNILNQNRTKIKTLKINTKKNFSEYKLTIKDCTIEEPSKKAVMKH